MNKRVSVIIPNYNGSATIGKCLDAACASDHGNFEVIVVDDGSTDDSVEIIKKFPCTLIRMNTHSGASKTRNNGAQNSRGKILFFTDADCILQKDTLRIADRTFKNDKNTVIGGSYTRIPYDDTFFSTFQSIFVNYSETSHENPDYIATHAMVIDADLFRRSGGFPEVFMPIIEDVEFSHRLRRSGCRLAMNPEMLVRHIFNFTFLKSLRNAFRKSMYWTAYSLFNKDLLKDSGTASIELKVNATSFLLNIFLLVLYFYHGSSLFLLIALILLSVNILVSSGLFKAFYETKGLLFSLFAACYYLFVYPVPVGIGALSGIAKFIWTRKSG
jgi:glycosyltransferase involved in cell wall biosynthesis